MQNTDGLSRCEWALEPGYYQEYHDHEWGIPCHDDRRLFEMLILEGKQAGLSWATILRRREGLRRAFDGFDPEIMAQYGEEKMAALMQDEAVIKNRLKLKAAVGNARAYLRLKEAHGSLDAYLWRYVDGEPVVGRWAGLSQVPASTPLSDRLSRDLKKQGFTFVGSVIVYAYMQSVGLVNDHTAGCFRCPE